MKMFRLGSLLALLVLVGTLVPVGLAATRSQTPNATVNIQFLNVSDWHAQLDPITMTVENVPNNPVGGAPRLSGYWKADRLANPNTITLTAGDDFGASPPLSGYFDEVPAILAQRMMGMSINTFGNHNFDRGTAHLQQMIERAIAPTALLTPTSIYTDGLPFPYVAANLINTTGVLTGVERFKIFDVQGVKVAVIGIVNPEAPSLVIPGAFGPIQITNPVAAAMAAKTEAQTAGAQVFVVITHMGLTAPNSGPLIDFANAVSGFDIIFGDHTDIKYSGTIRGALVTENLSKGVSYLKVNLTYDTTTNTVTNKTAQFVTPVGLATPSMQTIPAQDPAIVTMLKPYRDQLTAIFDVDIADATGLFPRAGNNERLGEAAIGNLVTDAMRAEYGTDIAFTNGGGLRSAIPSSYAPKNLALRRPAVGYAAGPPYDVVIGDVYSLLPFGNSIVTRPVTGGQLWQVLELSVAALPASNGRFGQISGFKFAYDVSRPVGSRVLNVELNNGTKILSDTTTYTMATNNFTNTGGDGYTMLNDGTGTTLGVMADVVRDYIIDQGVITPTIQGRIKAVNAPKISAIADQSTTEDTVAGPITFIVSDVETAANTLVLTGTSSNTALVSNANIGFGGSGITRTVTLTPTANMAGTTTISIDVFDGTYTTRETFVLNVNSVPDAPVLAGVADVITTEDMTATLNFTVNDLDNTDTLTVTATSSNQALVANASLVVSGTRPNYTLTMTPVANASGSVVITVTVNDGTHTVTDTFDLTVTAVNDLPTVGTIADLSTTEDTVAGPITFTVSDVETAANTLVLTGTSSNTALVSNANIGFGGSGITRTVTLTPTADMAGTTTINIDVFDGTYTTRETFVLTVNSVNDAPTVGEIADQTLLVGQATEALTLTVGDIDNNVATLTVTATSSNTNLVPNANIVIGGSGANRTVTVTPLPGVSGTTTITVTVDDGTATTTTTFEVTVELRQIFLPMVIR